MAALADAFRRELGYDGPSEAEFAARMPSLLDDPDTDLLVAYEGDGDERCAPGGELCAPGGDERCAGLLQLRYRRNIWAPGEEAYIEDLFVAEHTRRQGLGALLVETAIDRARARGCSTVTLDTNERNTRALALYERYGFRSGGGPVSEMRGGRQLWLELAL